MAFDDAFGSGQDQLRQSLLEQYQPDDGQPFSVEPRVLTDRLARKLSIRPTRDADVDFNVAPEKPKGPDLSSFGTPVKDEAAPEPSTDDLSRFGTPVSPEGPAAPPLTISRQAAAFAKGIPAGMADAAGGILQGGAALYENGVPAATSGPEYDITGAPTGTRSEPTEGTAPLPMKERGLYKAGKAVKDLGPTMTPEEKDSIAGRVGHGAGTLIPYVAAGIAGGAVAAPFGAIAATIGSLAPAAAGMATDTYGSVFEAAKEAGKSDEEASATAGKSALVAGVLGSLPLGAGKYAKGLIAKVAVSSTAFATLGEAQEAILQEIAKDYDPKAGYTFEQKRIIAALILGAGMGGLHHAFRDRDQQQPQPQQQPGAQPGQAPGGALPGSGPQPGPGAGPQPGAGPNPNGWPGGTGSWSQQPPPGGGAGPHPGAGPQGGPGPQPNTGGPGATGNASGNAGAKPGGPPPGTGTGKAGEAGYTMDLATRAKMERVYRHFEQGKDPSAMSDGELYDAVNEHLRDTSSTGHTAKPETPEEAAAREQTAKDRDQREVLKKAGWTDAHIQAMTPEQRAKYTARARGEPDGSESPQAKAAPETKAKAPDAAEATAARQAEASETDVVNPTPGRRDAPIKAATAADILDAQPAEPKSQAQAQAENYSHAHVEIEHLGLVGKNSISIETGVGQQRKGIGPDGKEWSVTMPVAYGRIKGTKGGDGQPLDIFIGPDPTSAHVFVIDQHHGDGGGFDEHKIMAGFPGPDAALRAYGDSYLDKGGDRIGHVTAMTPTEFQAWRKGDTSLALKKDINKRKIDSNVQESTQERAAGPKSHHTPEPALTNPDSHHTSGEVEGANQQRGASSQSDRSPPEITKPSDSGPVKQNATKTGGMVGEYGQPTATKTPPKRAVEPHNLLQFIASKGGLKPHPELSVMDAHKHLVSMSGFPPRRKLVKDDGMDLDRAREAAEEAGYFRRSAEGTSTIADFLDAIDDGIRGKHLYAEGDEGHRTKRELTAEEERAAYEETQAKELVDQLEAAGHGAMGAEIKDRVLHLMAVEGMDPDTAVDTAMVQLAHEEYERATAGFIDDTYGHGAYDAIHAEIPFEDGEAAAPGRESVHGDEEGPPAEPRARLPDQGEDVGREDEGHDARRAEPADGEPDAGRPAGDQAANGRAENPADAERSRHHFAVERATDERWRELVDAEIADVHPGDIFTGVRLNLEHGSLTTKNARALLKALGDEEIPHDESIDILARSKIEKLQGGEVIQFPYKDEHQQGRMWATLVGMEDGYLRKDRKPTQKLRGLIENPPPHLPPMTAEMEAADSDETVTVTLSRKGPWDFNDTWPAPDMKRIADLAREGRSVFEIENGESPDVEQIVGVLDEGMNGIMSALSQVRAIDGMIADIRSGKTKLKKKQKPEDAIKALQAERSTLGREAVDTAASYEEVFGNEAARAMMIEARRRLRGEDTQRDKGVDRRVPEPEEPKAHETIQRGRDQAKRINKKEEDREAKLRAEQDNERKELERKLALLPDGIDAMLADYKSTIDKFDESMISGKRNAILADRLDLLEIKANGGTSFGVATAESDAEKLRNAGSAPIGTVPKWGQRGVFQITVDGMDFIVTHDAGSGPAIYATDKDKPFPSETGYRSMAGGTGVNPLGKTVEQYWREVVAKTIAEGAPSKKGKASAPKTPSAWYRLPDNYDDRGYPERVGDNWDEGHSLHKAKEPEEQGGFKVGDTVTATAVGGHAFTGKIARFVKDYPDGKPSAEIESVSQHPDKKGKLKPYKSLSIHQLEKLNPPPAPTTDTGADNKPQMVMPGAEKAGDGTMAKRAAAAPLKPKVAQKAADDGLFGDGHKQTDLMDMVAKAPAPPKDAFDDIFDQAIDAEFAPKMSLDIDDVAKGLGKLFGKGLSETEASFVDEEKYRAALPFFKAGVEHFGGGGADLATMVRSLVRHLSVAGMDAEAIRAMKPYIRRFTDDVTAGRETINAPSRSDVLESDRGNPAPENGVGKADVPAAAGPSGQSAGKRGSAADAGDERSADSGSVSQDHAPAVGARGNLELPHREPVDEGGDAADRDHRRSGADSQSGFSFDDDATDEAVRNAQKDSDLNARRQRQQQADRQNIPYKWGRIDNIAASLPMLFPEQHQDVQGAELRFIKAEGHGMLFTNGTGTGKAQPLDAKILTPTGWRLMKNISVGDHVIGASGRATEVVGVYPQGEKEIYRVTFSDGAETECCDDHLWLTQTLYERRKASANPAWECAKPKVRSLSEIRGSLEKKHFVPVVGAVQFAASGPLPIPAYAMGVLLGDGSLTGGALIFTTADPEMADAVAESLPTGFVVSPVLVSGGRCAAYRISTNLKRKTNGTFGGHPMIAAMRDMGLMGKLSATKFVPAEYLSASIPDRLALLRGLMDADGWADKRTNSAYFTTISERLCGDVTELVRSLGGITSLTVKKPTYRYGGVLRDGQPAFNLCIHMPTGMVPFSLSRKAASLTERQTEPRRRIVSVDLVGRRPAQCIAVADAAHLYVTNDFVVTHNTYSGGGVIKRFFQQGKRDVLVIAPSQGILMDWQRSMRDLGLDMHLLDSTVDKGKGLTGTTYANLGANRTLADREWDLVVADEAHKLSSDKDGTKTSALETFRALTLHPDGLTDRARMILRTDWDRIEHLPKDKQAAAYAEFQKKADPLIAKWKDEQRPKALMMSATPFAYHFSLDYAEGYLFDFDREDQGSRYNSGGGREKFYMQHLGYRMRTNKLTKPDADVKSEVMERQLHEYLKKQGSLSGRALTVDKDYDRKFVLAHNAAGELIDRALNFLQEAEGGRYRPLHEIISKQFDYLARMRLLEAMKAQDAIGYIKESLDLGRKVVVFHDYNEGGGISPFTHRPPEGVKVTSYVDGKHVETKLRDLYDDFVRQNPYVKDLDFAAYPAPIYTLTQAFPDAMVYNGTVSNKVRNEAKRLFNDDNSGRDIIIVQSAAGEAGISLHDTSGKRQRVLLNLGMPIRPTSSIQQEGRIYRVGQASDAIFRYMNTGTDWERWTFAGKIAERAGTAENLALGDQARTIRQSFIDAFSNAGDYAPEHGEGKGGKEIDRAISHSVSEFTKAKTHYFANGKTTGRRDQREGTDYYATPEPVGLKMVEFAGVKSGEKMLEPSAGHGAIARYFPEDTARTLVEPSSSLASRAALNTPGARVVVDRFENLDTGANKFDAIVMNPPFGTGGKTAVDHLRKAIKHLKNGGRIVALIPDGQGMRRVEELTDGDDWTRQGMHFTAEIKLPSVTFERAGTAIRTTIVVFDKQTDPAISAKMPPRMYRDYSGEEKIGDLFDRIEHAEMPPRLEPVTKDIDIPTEGKVTVGGVEFSLESSKRGDIHAANLKTFLGASRFRDVVNASAETGGEYVKSAKRFDFKTEAARQAFLDRVANPPSEPELPKAPSGVTFKTGETIHAKTRANLFVATANERVDGGVYSQMNAVAKANGGYYSSFKGRGAIPGFQFKSAEERQKFLDQMGGGLGEPEPPFTADGSAPSYSKPAGERGQQWTLTQGRKTGVEHLIAYDAEGIAVSRREGTKDRVTVTPEFIAAIKDPKNDIVAHHNHPQGSSFSGDDIRMLAARGLRAIWAHGHDGDVYRAELTPDASAALPANPDIALTVLNNIYNGAYSRLFSALTPEVAKKTVSADEASYALLHLVSQSLHDAGIIDYRTNFELGDFVSRVPGLSDVVKAAVKAARKAVFGDKKPTVDDALGKPPSPLRHVGDLGAVFDRATLASGFGEHAVEHREGRANGGDEARGGAEVGFDGFAQPSNAFKRPGSHDVAIADILRTRLLGRLGDLNATEARTQLQDKFARVKNAEESVGAPSTQSAHQAESLYYGRTGQRLEALTEHHIDPLIREMKARDIDLDSLDDFLYARHAPERNQKLGRMYADQPGHDFYKAVHDPDVVGASGMSTNDALGVIRALRNAGKLQDYLAVARMVDALNARTRRALFDAGLIDRDTFDAWNSGYKYYVPLRGHAEGAEFMASGSGMNVRGKEAKTAFGRRSKADSPVAYTIMQAEMAVVRAEKNRVGNTFLKFVRANPDPDRWTIDRPPLVKRIDPSTGLVTAMPDNLYANKDHVFSTKVDGRDVYIALHGPDGLNLARALKNMGTANVHRLIRAYSTITHTMAKLATSWNPEFMIPNLARDFGEAFINLSAQEQRGFARNFVKHIPGAMRGATAAIAGRTPPAGSNLARYVDAFKEFDAAGGRVRFFGIDDPDQIETNVNRRLKRLEGGPLNTLKDIGDKASRALEIAGGGIENATRLAAYMAARDAGFSIPDAAMFGRNLTVDFNKKGELGGAFSALYMFANAGVQGQARMVRALGSRRVWQAVAALAAAAALSTLYSILASDVDETGIPDYMKIPTWERDKNLIFTLPGHHYLKVPLPYGFSPFAVIGSHSVSVAMGHEKPGKAAHAIMDSIISAFNPLGEESSMWMDIVPSAMRPAFHIQFNKNWTGKPLYPEQDKNRGNRPDSTQAFKSNSAFSKEAAKQLNAWSGGNPYQPGAIDVHPASIDHALQAITGGVGRFAKGIADSMYNNITGGEWQPEKAPIMRRFVGKIGPEADAALYYEKRQESLDEKAGVNAARKDLKGGVNTGEAQQFLADTPSSKASIFKSADDRIKALRAQKNLTEPELRDRIRQVQNSARAQVQRLQPSP